MSQLFGYYGCYMECRRTLYWTGGLYHQMAWQDEASHSLPESVLLDDRNFCSFLFLCAVAWLNLFQQPKPKFNEMQIF